MRIIIPYYGVCTKRLVEGPDLSENELDAPKMQWDGMASKILALIGRWHDSMRFYGVPIV